MALKYKMAEDGKAILIDEAGLPILVDDDGKETAIDAIGLYSKVPTLSQEARDRRLENKTLKERLATYEGIEDPAAAIAALTTVQNLADGDLVKAKDMEALKAKLSKEHKDEVERIVKASKDKDDTSTAAIADLDSTVRRLVISNAFKGSDRIRGIAHIPLDMIEARFGANFKAEKTESGDTVPVGYLNNAPIYAKSDPTKFAGFEEAFETMVNAHPEKDKFAVGKGGGPQIPGNLNTPAAPSKLPGGAERIKAGLEKSGRF